MAFAVEAAGAGVFAWEMDQDRLLPLNDRFYTLLGLAPEDRVWTRERFLSELLHPDDRTLFDFFLAEPAPARAAPAQVLCRIYRKGDGALRWMELFGLVERAADGTPQRPIGAILDVTEQQIRENELNKLNRILKAHKDSYQAMITAESEEEFLHSVCRIIVEDCGHALVWIGLIHEDAGKTIQPVASAGFEAGYLEKLNLTWADTERGQGPTGMAIRTGRPSLCGNMATDPTFASWRDEALQRGYASSVTFPLSSGGRIFGVLSIYSRTPDPYSEDEVRMLSQLADDLAHGLMAVRLRQAHERAEEARRFTEERFRSLVELSPDAVLVARNHQVEFVNPSALRLLGAETDVPLLGQSLLALFHREFQPCVRERLQQLMMGNAVPLFEGRLLRLNGEVRDVEVAAGTFMDANGLAIQVVLRDITRRKKAEEALFNMAEELVRSNRDLEQFAYVASHDLKEPLRMVTGFMSLLKNRYQGRLDAKADEYIGFAMDASTRMQELIDALLAYSRVGRNEPTEEVDMALALTRAISNLSVRIQEVGAVVTHDPLPADVRVPVALTQVFQNLIGNAVKFRGKARPRVHVGVERKDSHWLFSVKDNGIGIEPEFSQRIFMMFQRLHTREEYPGAGVGLAICKKIVERQGGRIWVESRKGDGATFYFLLPAREGLLKRP